MRQILMRFTQRGARSVVARQSQMLTHCKWRKRETQIARMHSETARQVSRSYANTFSYTSSQVTDYTYRSIILHYWFSWSDRSPLLLQLFFFNLWSPLLEALGDYIVAWGFAQLGCLRHIGTISFFIKSKGYCNNGVQKTENNNFALGCIWSKIIPHWNWIGA